MPAHAATDASARGRSECTASRQAAATDYTV